MSDLMLVLVLIYTAYRKCWSITWAWALNKTVYNIHRLLTWSWAAQIWQHTMWPHGQKVVLISPSQHRAQVRASCSLWSLSRSAQVPLQPSQEPSSSSVDICLARESAEDLNRVRRARSYASLDVRWTSKIYFFPTSTLSLRKSEARWALKSRLYCIITVLVTVSHLKVVK